MSPQDIASFIQQFGFPVVMCGVLMWYIYKQDTRHKEETDKLSEALNNNTLVMQQLVDEMRDKKDD